MAALVEENGKLLASEEEVEDGDPVIREEDDAEASVEEDAELLASEEEDEVG